MDNPQINSKDIVPYLLKHGPQTPRARDLGWGFGKSQCFVVFVVFWGTNKQIVQLQQLNKLFYRRVAQWVKRVKPYPAIRLTKITCHDPKCTEVFFFPTRAMTDEWLANGVLNLITGFENNKQDGKGSLFNFIVTNGARS